VFGAVRLTGVELKIGLVDDDIHPELGPQRLDPSGIAFQIPVVPLGKENVALAYFRHVAYAPAQRPGVNHK
jgi:hypothetical protein